MSRVARTGMKRTAPIAAFIAGVAVVAFVALAPQARAQSGGFGAQITTVLASVYPADWQRTNSLANMTVFNGSGETVTADIKVTLFRDGAQVAVTPNVPRTYSNGTTLYPTYQLTQWQTLGFTGKVGEAIDQTGRLPDGVYQVCIDITNVMTVSGAPLNSVSTCGQFVAFFPKPPSLIFPEDGTILSAPNPVFQWSPILSQAGRAAPHLFRMVEVYPGQTSLQAIEANRPIYEWAFTTTSSFAYPTSAPYLLDGHRYAWRVQALYSVSPPSASLISVAAFKAPPIRPIGENEGRSKVYTFTWTADPRGDALRQGGAIGSSAPASDRRMGSVGEARHRAAGAESMESESPRARGAGDGENFADRLVRVMASMWRHGPGAAAAAARAAHMTNDGRMAQGTSGSGKVATPSGSVSYPPDSTPDSTLDAVSDSVTAEAASGTAPVSMSGSMEGPGLGPGWARLHGTASLTGEAYSRDGSGSPTRPDRSSRVVTGLSVGILKDRMRIPVSALVSDDQVAFRQNINQIAVAPRWQWAGVTAGNFSPQFSTYTLADATILGAGFELNPKRWRLGVVSGRSRKAITPTFEAVVTPQFERNVTAGRIGYGDAAANTIEFSVMRANDDESSIAGAESTLALTPEGNTVYALRAQRLLPSRNIRVQLETALSRYDRDRRADAPVVDGRAVGLQLAHETPLSRIGLKAEYLNSGFMTLGNSGITGDRVDLGVNARVQLLQGRLSLDGSAGIRNDAVSTALAAETRRRNYGVNGSWQPGPRFGADVQMAVYENESDAADSLLLGTSNTTRIYSLMPRTAWVVGRVQNSLSCTATIQKSDNASGVASFLSTNSLSLLASWSAIISTPWTVMFSGNYARTDYDIAVTETSAFGPGFTWAAFRSKLLTTAQLQVTRSRTGNAGTDSELTPRLEMRWEIAPRQAFVFRGNFRRFQYADPGTAEFNERVASLEYVTNL
jgi:hypothetical protein